jgi:hypothetical protein
MKNVNLEKAEAYLYYDEDTLSLEEMVQAIYEMSLTDPTTCFQDVDGVQPIESMEYSSMSCKEFIDSCYDKFSNLKLTRDDESLNIYIDNGDDQDPTHICYWHFEEWEEDAETVVPAMLTAMELFYTNPQELLNRLGIES